MRPHSIHHAVRCTALALLLAAVPSCGSETPFDWKNREIDWTYGPTTGTATAEHLAGTGAKGGAAIAKGWKFWLSDGQRLTVEPYQLAESHALFGQVKLLIGLFDAGGTQLATVRSDAVTAENATFSFEVASAVAQELNDVVIWFAAM